MVSIPSRSDDDQGMCGRVKPVARECPINNLYWRVAEDDAKRVLVEVCVLDDRSHHVIKSLESTKRQCIQGSQEGDSKSIPSG